MASQSVKHRIGVTALDGRSKEELLLLFASLVDGLQALAAKLDADATVTDTDYASTLATYIQD